MKMFLAVIMALCMVYAVQAEEPAAVPAVEAPAVEVSDPAEVSVPVPVPVNGVALVTAGTVEADLVARVQKYIQDNLFTTVMLLEPMELAEGAMDGQAQAAVLQKKDNHLAVLVLASLDGNTHHGASYPEQRVSVINVAALRPDPMDAELYGRRVEKQLMSAGGILLGMEICPNPLCALSAYNDMERLDAKGRNYCPPCQDRVKKLLNEKNALLEPVPAE